MRHIACFAFALALAVCFFAEAFAQQTKVQAPGKMVDIGGYKLYVDCRGKGSPTVVLDYGGGDVSTVWSLVQPEIARYTHVCSVDRSYDGFSDAGPIPTSLHQQAFELRLLLQTEHIAPPYVLVGHSIGGLMDQVYKSLYSDEIGGMVLVDSTDVDTALGDKSLRNSATGRAIPPAHSMAGESLPAYTPEQQQLIANYNRILAQEAKSPLQGNLAKLPSDIQPLWRLEHSHFTLVPGDPPQVWWAEEAALLYRERQEKEHLYGDMPLVVLAGQSAIADPGRLREVNNLATLSTDVRLLIAPQSGHRMQLDVPWLVNQSVQDVVTALRQHKTLENLSER
jgi:pimeloyl-ACP methyl ester carboxylesterase